MDRAQRMGDMGSRDVARASVMLAMTRTREEERRFKEEYAAEGIRTAAVDFGGEFLPSVSRIVERAVIAAKRGGVVADTSHEEGVVAGATHEAIMQISAKAMGLNVGGKIGIARCEQHVAVSLFLAIRLVHLNEICLGMSHRSV